MCLSFREQVDSKCLTQEHRRTSQYKVNETLNEMKCEQQVEPLRCDPCVSLKANIVAWLQQFEVAMEMLCGCCRWKICPADVNKDGCLSDEVNAGELPVIQV